jgi:hypothetical protein
VWSCNSHAALSSSNGVRLTRTLYC